MNFKQFQTSALCPYSGWPFVYIPDVIFVKQNIKQMHCVYILDAILCIFRMSLVWFKTEMKVHCVHIPDAIWFIFRMPRLFQKQNKLNKHCVNIPAAILSIFRMSRLLKSAIKKHCVYIPDAILSVLWMSLLL